MNEIAGMTESKRTWRSIATIPILALITFIGYLCHAAALTTGVVDLVLILIIAFR